MDGEEMVKVQRLLDKERAEGVAQGRAAQLKEDLAAVKQIPQYMLDVMEGWLEGSAKSAQTKVVIALTEGCAKYVEELIPDLFPKEAGNENQKD